ncbi:MAG: DUF1634 domain-containing protein [Acidobacteria bacterium]|nr:DUF1634 domain-containing protein [Acidobacteriota bacterium]MBV9478946.1 DUF1634 domain-containing protein [Acidobacteriota bacterium]
MSVAPPQHEPRWVDSAISHLLRTGVVLSVAIVLAGLALSFVHHPQYVTSRTALHGLTDANGVYPHTLRDVVVQLREGRGEAIVMLGLLLLIATPVARVAFSVVAFALERDRLYVAITMIVLSLLVLSFVIGAAE